MNVSARERTRARRAAVQALYQWRLTGNSTSEIDAQFGTDWELRGVDEVYFHELLEGIPRHADAIDAALAPLLDRPLSQLDPVEHTILSIGAFELRHRPDVPDRVVINEAIELAKTFGAEQSHKYVNSVLDQLARRIRAERKAGDITPESR